MNHPDPALARARAKAQLRRGMFLLPSLFTVGNIAAGFFSIIQTMAALVDAGNAHTHLDWAALAIIFAIPFDALDGRIARMTNTCSDFGKELDSLADAITFGVAPSLLALIWGFHFLSDTMDPRLHEDLLHAGAFICFLYLIGGVSRLARFNISHDPQPRNPGRPDRKYFVGMPIPAGAGLLAACVHFCGGYPVEAWWIALIWLGIVGTSGFLMVSTWRFWSGKELSLSRRHPFQVLFFISIALFIIVRFSQAVLFLWALTYMFSGIWARAAYSWSRRRRWRSAGVPVSLPEPSPAEKEPLDRS
jgi:CDP-diacylglycerol--serine O-phosphatidyltransferase